MGMIQRRLGLGLEPGGIHMHSRCSPAYSGTELTVDFRFACSIMVRNLYAGLMNKPLGCVGFHTSCRLDDDAGSSHHVHTLAGDQRRTACLRFRYVMRKMPFAEK